MARPPVKREAALHARAPTRWQATAARRGRNAAAGGGGAVGERVRCQPVGSMPWWGHEWRTGALPEQAMAQWRLFTGPPTILRAVLPYHVGR